MQESSEGTSNAKSFTEDCYIFVYYHFLLQCNRSLKNENIEAETYHLRLRGTIVAHQRSVIFLYEKTSIMHIKTFASDVSFERFSRNYVWSRWDVGCTCPWGQVLRAGFGQPVTKSVHLTVSPLLISNAAWGSLRMSEPTAFSPHE